MAKRFAAWLWEFRRLLTGNELQDLWVRDDRAPAIAEMRQFARDRLLSSRASLFRATPVDKTAERKRLELSLGSHTGRLSILFLCQGNICRSPYAELKLRQMMPESGVADLSSAGLLPRNARPSPATAQAVAAQRGVDLSAHRSRHAFADTVSAATHVFIFDETNMRSFIARYPEMRERVFFLATLSPEDPNHEILDPDGRNASVFEQTYARVDSCLNRLLPLLNRRT
jgi:protein-tyrosine-phosphatase